MLHSPFIKYLEQICSRVENRPVKLRTYEKIYGGDINQTYRLAMTQTDYFIKINTADRLDMFEKEAAGLQLLQNSKSFMVPKVYKTGIFENQSFLLMEYIESLERGTNPVDFAQNLVKLHQNTRSFYGLDFDNYIGRLPQQNIPASNWVDFYIENRLQYQIDLAGKLIPAEIKQDFEKLYQKLPVILPMEKPALLHGDLWNGNYFYNLQGKAVVFDPAVYYGHREVDLAMMSLFGGFEKEIYSLYNRLFTLDPGWKERLKIYQLYPLLVHLNLFGKSYLQGIKQILKSFV